MCIVKERNYWDVKNGSKISVYSRIGVSSHDFRCLMKKLLQKKNNDDKSERLIASVFLKRLARIDDAFTRSRVSCFGINR